MFIPKRCPRCKDVAGWTEIYNPNTANPIEQLIRLIKDGSRWNYVYRCDKCGYEGEYDDYAERLMP